MQGLFDEIGHHAPVIHVHIGAIGVEDAHHARVQAVKAVVSHGQGFGEALGLIVHRAGADRVDMAPIALDLGVFQGIAVDLAGGGQQETRLVGLATPRVLCVPNAPAFMVWMGRLT